MATRKKRTYHHGDLRQTVLDASLRLIETDGITALSLREVARRAGVTHGAPYWHFSDKAGLLDALADEGFGVLRDAMRAARRGVSGASKRLAACGRAYVEFAVAHTPHFEVMFRPGRSGRLRRTQAGAEAFQVLVDSVAECQREGLAPPGPREPLTLLAWSAVHGLAALWVDGALPNGDPAKLGKELPALLSRLYAAAGKRPR